MKTYVGELDGNLGWQVYVLGNKSKRGLNPRFDLRRHSPDGFAWGYAGSGPAQLALALCADVLKDDTRAQRVYQTFKFRVVAGWDKDKVWSLTDVEIMDIILDIELSMRNEWRKGITEDGERINSSKRR